MAKKGASKKAVGKPLKISSVAIQRPGAGPQASSLAALEAQIQLSVTVENPGDQPLHVWATRRAYDFDPASGVLTIYLTERTPPPPPGITIISNHPRTPAQVVVPGRGRATINVSVPATIRRRIPAAGLGISFVEDPIGTINKVDLFVQSASRAFEFEPGEPPDRHRERLRQLGEVVRTTITPTGPKEQ